MGKLITDGNVPNKNVSTKNVHKNVYTSFIHNGPKLEKKKNSYNLQKILHNFFGETCKILLSWEYISNPIIVPDSNNVLHLYRTLKLQISHISHS